MNIHVNSPDNQPDRGSEPDDELSGFFAAYAAACPEIGPSADFLPGIWRRIERRQSFWFSFEQLAKGCAAFAVAICLLLVALNVEASRRTVPMPGGYADALAAEHNAERTFYAEGIRTAPAIDSADPASR